MDLHVDVLQPEAPQDRYNFRSATLLSAYLWLRLTPVKVIVTIAYEVGPTNTQLLQEFVSELSDIGAIPKLLAVDPTSTCDCVTQALWQRNLAYHHLEMEEEDLMMISESDVFITTSNILQPLSGDFRAWVYLSEPAHYGGKYLETQLSGHHIGLSGMGWLSSSAAKDCEARE